MWEEIVMEKLFLNLSLKAGNLQKIWDMYLEKQRKVRTIFETECFFNLFLELIQI